MAKAGQNAIPERLSNFRVYNDNNDCIGIASVELPSLEYLSDTVSGAGIAGEVDSPIVGHFGSMETTFTWRTIDPKAIKLGEQKSHTLDLRGAQQIHDAGNGTYSQQAVRATLKVIPKSLSLGSFEPNSTTDTESVFEVTYIKLYIGGKEVMEIDKYNYICKFGDKDVLSEVRSALGLS